MAHPRLIAYIACMYSREVLAFELHADTGAVSELQSMPLRGAAAPMALPPNRKFLYVGLRSEPYRVASLAIDPATGKLTDLGDAPAAQSMPFLSTDRTGRHLLGVTNPWHGPAGQGGEITVSAIAANGAAQAPHQVLPAFQKTHSVLPSPSNRHVYAASCDEHFLACWAFDAGTGKLTPNPATHAVDAGAGPRHFVFHPNGRFLYLLTEYESALYVFAHDAVSGALEQRQAARLRARPGPGKSVRASDIHITPNGRFLYAAERCSNTLTAYQVNTDGTLTCLAAYATEHEPRGFNIDPLGRFVVVVGRLSDGLTVYAIDSTSGTLTPVCRRPVASAPPAQGLVELPPMKPEEHGLRGPNWVEIVQLP
jgi:6-phosphogluconolactonase